MSLVLRLWSLLMLPALLWSSMGFSVSRHYCLGLLKSERFYFSAATCAMQADTGEDHLDGEADHGACLMPKLPIEDKPYPEDYQWLEDLDCCESEWLNISPVEIEKLSTELKLEKSSPSIGTPVLSLVNILPALNQHSLPVFTVRPPPKRQLLLSLWQRYLI